VRWTTVVPESQFVLEQAEAMGKSWLALHYVDCIFSKLSIVNIKGEHVAHVGVDQGRMGEG
jgi:hypothetical protein